MKFAAQAADLSTDPEDNARAAVLHYANSGDVPAGQRDGVVGYAAVAFWLDEQADQSPESFEVPAVVSEPGDPIPLSPEAQDELLALDDLVNSRSDLGRNCTVGGFKIDKRYLHGNLAGLQV